MELSPHLVEEISNAADLESASELFAKVFGETGEECGEAYMLYGKALLNASIMENEVNRRSALQKVSCRGSSWEDWRFRVQHQGGLRAVNLS